MGEEACENSVDYEARIYAQYVRLSGREEADAEVLLGSRRPYLLEFIRRTFPRDLRSAIVDLGCGHGAIVHFARWEGYGDVVGVDRSPEQVAKAHALGIRGVVKGDVREYLAALRPESVDVVVAFDLIEHLRKKDMFILIDSVRRVLRPGGRWIIHAPNGGSPFVGRVLYGDITHEQAFTPQSLDQILKGSGFSEVRYLEDAPVPHGAKSLVRFLVWKIVRSVLRVYLAAETGETGRNGIYSQNLVAIAIR